MTRLTPHRVARAHDAALGAELHRRDQQRAAEERCVCGGLVAVQWDCVCDEDEPETAKEVDDV